MSGARPRSRSPVRIGDAIGQYLHRLGLDRRLGRRSVAEAWAEILGPVLSGQTRLRGVQRGVLTVEVPSPVVRHDLENFRGAELLRRLQDVVPGEGIKKIRFTVGR